MCSIKTLSFSFGDGGCSLVLKNQGLPKIPRPTIIPSAFEVAAFFIPSSRLNTSPLPMITVFVFFARSTAFLISFQWAGTSDISFFVLPWSAIAAGLVESRVFIHSVVMMVL